MTIGPFTSVRRSIKDADKSSDNPALAHSFTCLLAPAVKSLHANIAPLIYCLPSSEQLIHVVQAIANAPNAVAAMQTIVLTSERCG
jgi:hypothetical protein